MPSGSAVRQQPKREMSLIYWRALPLVNVAGLVGSNHAEKRAARDTTTHHSIKLRTNNPVERNMREMRCRTRAVGEFSDRTCCLRNGKRPTAKSSTTMLFIYPFLMRPDP